MWLGTSDVRGVRRGPDRRSASWSLSRSGRLPPTLHWPLLCRVLFPKLSSTVSWSAINYKFLLKHIVYARNLWSPQLASHPIHVIGHQSVLQDCNGRSRCLIIDGNIKGHNLRLRRRYIQNQIFYLHDTFQDYYSSLKFYAFVHTSLGYGPAARGGSNYLP